MRNHVEKHLWFEFGRHPDGCVDIANADGDVLCGLPHDLAERIIEAHNAALRAITADETRLTPPRYLAFCGDHYYPEGGWRDYVGAFDTVDEARAATAPAVKGWWQVVDRANACVVASGTDKRMTQ